MDAVCSAFPRGFTRVPWRIYSRWMDGIRSSADPKRKKRTKIFPHGQSLCPPSECRCSAWRPSSAENRCLSHDGWMISGIASLPADLVFGYPAGSLARMTPLSIPFHPPCPTLFPFHPHPSLNTDLTPRPLLRPISYLSIYPVLSLSLIHPSLSIYLYFNLF